MRTPKQAASLAIVVTWISTFVLAGVMGALLPAANSFALGRHLGQIGFWSSLPIGFAVWAIQAIRLKRHETSASC